jgi:hypothetical protein
MPRPKSSRKNPPKIFSNGRSVAHSFHRSQTPKMRSAAPITMPMMLGRLGVTFTIAIMKRPCGTRSPS